MTSVGEMSVASYLARLASSDAAPGGGAAAALTAAQAAALLAMVGRVSRKADAQPESDVPALAVLTDLDQKCARLLELASEDGQAFAAVLAAYRLPAANPADKALRRGAIQEALKGAAQPPLEVLRIAADLHDAVVEILKAARASVVSDAAVAVHLLGAAVRTAACNVRVNLDAVKDEAWCANTKLRMTKLKRGRKKQRRDLLKRVAALKVS